MDTEYIDYFVHPYKMDLHYIDYLGDLAWNIAKNKLYHSHYRYFILM